MYMFAHNYLYNDKGTRMTPYTAHKLIIQIQISMVSCTILKRALLNHLITSSRHLDIHTFDTAYFIMKVHAVASSADCNLLDESFAH